MIVFDDALALEMTVGKQQGRQNATLSNEQVGVFFTSSTNQNYTEEQACIDDHNNSFPNGFNPMWETIIKDNRVINFYPTILLFLKYALVYH